MVDFATIAAVANAGLKVFSAFKSNKKVRAQPQTSSLDLVELRREAQRAGFNPLTVLRSGASQGFMTTHAPVMASSGMMKANLAMGMAGALNDVVPLFDSQQKRNASLSEQLTQAQIENLRADTERTGRMSRMPMAPTIKVYNGQSASGQLAYGGEPLPVQKGEVTATNPHKDLLIDATLRDAEAWEQRYGDVAQEIGGLVTAWGDFKKNMPDTGDFFKDGIINPHRIERGARRVVDFYNATGLPKLFGGERRKVLPRGERPVIEKFSVVRG